MAASLAAGWTPPLGPKRSLQIALFMSILGVFALLGMSPTRILYFWSFDPQTATPLWSGPVFRLLPDLVFMLIGFFECGLHHRPVRLEPHHADPRHPA